MTDTTLDRHGEPSRALPIASTVGVAPWTRELVLEEGEKRLDMGKCLESVSPPCHGCGGPLKSGGPIAFGAHWICLGCGRILCNRCAGRPGVRRCRCRGGAA